MKFINFRQAALILAGFAAVFSTHQASAIAFLHSGAGGNPEDPFSNDASFNTTRPGDDKGLPWDSVGFYNGGGGGTAVSSRWFMSATHVGNDGIFTLPDNNPLTSDNYNVIQNFQVPGTDLSFHKVDRDLPSFTSLYTGNPLTDLPLGNTPLLIIGSGYVRETPVFSGGGTLLGWNFGGNRSKAWALNNLDVINDEFNPGDPWWRSKFKDNTFGNSEGQVTPGDSGGGAFVKQNGVWRALGPVSFAINYDSPLPWALIERLFNTPQGLQLLSSESSGYIAELYLEDILRNTDIPDPRLESVPEAGALYASAGLLLSLVITHRRKVLKRSEAA